MHACLEIYKTASPVAGFYVAPSDKAAISSHNMITFGTRLYAVRQILFLSIPAIRKMGKKFWSFALITACSIKLWASKFRIADLLPGFRNLRVNDESRSSISQVAINRWVINKCFGHTWKVRLFKQDLHQAIHVLWQEPETRCPINFWNFVTKNYRGSHLKAYVSTSRYSLGKLCLDAPGFDTKVLMNLRALLRQLIPPRLMSSIVRNGTKRDINWTQVYTEVGKFSCLNQRQRFNVLLLWKYWKPVWRANSSKYSNRRTSHERLNRILQFRAEVGAPFRLKKLTTVVHADIFVALDCLERYATGLYFLRVKLTK